MLHVPVDQLPRLNEAGSYWEVIQSDQFITWPKDMKTSTIGQHDWMSITPKRPEVWTPGAPATLVVGDYLMSLGSLLPLTHWSLIWFCISPNFKATVVSSCLVCSVPITPILQAQQKMNWLQKLALDYLLSGLRRYPMRVLGTLGNIPQSMGFLHQGICLIIFFLT